METFSILKDKTRYVQLNMKFKIRWFITFTIEF